MRVEEGVGESDEGDEEVEEDEEGDEGSEVDVTGSVDVIWEVVLEIGVDGLIASVEVSEGSDEDAEVEVEEGADVAASEEEETLYAAVELSAAVALASESEGCTVAAAAVAALGAVASATVSRQMPTQTSRHDRI